MKKIEAIIRPDKLEEIKDALNKYDIHGLTISQVMGCGLQKGRKEFYRGVEINLNLLPKVKIELVIKDSQLDNVVELLTKTARTGQIGDGKIFVSDIKSVIRIRTGEKDDSAI